MRSRQVRHSTTTVVRPAWMSSPEPAGRAPDAPAERSAPGGPGVPEKKALLPLNSSDTPGTPGAAERSATGSTPFSRSTLSDWLRPWPVASPES